MLTVLLVDEQPVVRIGLDHLLKAQPRFKVVGETGSASEAVEKAKELKPDIVITDVRLAEGSGIDVCRQISEGIPETKVIMFTSHSDGEAIFSAIMAGATGYLLKQITPGELITAVEKVGRGESLLDSEITGKVIEKMKNLAKNGAQEELNPQEKRILCLIAEGKTNREIGDLMSLSEKTVKNYVSAVFSKLNINNRAEAAVYAVKNFLQ